MIKQPTAIVQYRDGCGCNKRKHVEHIELDAPFLCRGTHFGTTFGPLDCREEKITVSNPDRLQKILFIQKKTAAVEVANFPDLLQSMNVKECNAVDIGQVETLEVNKGGNPPCSPVTRTYVAPRSKGF